MTKTTDKEVIAELLAALKEAEAIVGVAIGARVMPPLPYTGPLIAEVGSSAANARLIAAAPELLASLREVVASWDGTRDVIGSSIKAKLARADAAIAKAEGHVPPAAPLCIHGRDVCGICQEAQQ